MKKQIFIMAIIMIAALFVSNQASAQSFTLNPKNGWFENVKFDPQNFMDVYSSATQLNHRRFDDINQINIGDTVLFPARTIDGDIEYWIADAPAAHDGRHDCIWRLTERYLANQLPTKPAVIVIKPQPDPVAPVEKQEIPWWAWLLLALFAGGILYLFLRDQIAQREKSRNNPDAFPPVITGGLSDNDEEARRQIAENSNLSPNNIVRIQRGVLVRHSGVNEVLAMMAFGDHGRSMYIRPGERVTKVTLLKNSKEVVEYWRNHCGNRFGMIAANGQFIMPEGWEFVENQPTTENASAATASPTPTPTPEPTSELESMLTAISKVMPKGTKKFNLEYEVGGKKNKIKLEME